MNYKFLVISMLALRAPLWAYELSPMVAPEVDRSSGPDTGAENWVPKGPVRRAQPAADPAATLPPTSSAPAASARPGSSHMREQPKSTPPATTPMFAPPAPARRAAMNEMTGV